MYQTPVPVWNAIAQSQALSQPWADLFRLDPEALSAALQGMEASMAQKGADPKVIRSFLLTAPLLVENEAISTYLEESNRFSLRSSMPELTTVNEAVILASQEYRLSTSQQAQLSTLLEEALTNASE